MHDCPWASIGLGDGDLWWCTPLFKEMEIKQIDDWKLYRNHATYNINVRLNIYLLDIIHHGYRKPYSDAFTSDQKLQF